MLNSSRLWPCAGTSPKVSKEAGSPEFICHFKDAVTNSNNLKYHVIQNSSTGQIWPIGR